MVHAVLSLLLESFLLVLVVTMLFWGLVGIAAADRAGRSRRLGLVVGTVAPGVGWAFLLIPAKKERAAAVVAAAPALPPAAPLWNPPAPTAGAPLLWNPSPAEAPWLHQQVMPWDQQPGAAVPTATSSRRRTRRSSYPIVGIGVAAVLVLLGALLESWVDVSVASVTGEAYAGGDSLFTGIPLVLSAVVLGVSVGLQLRRPRGTWCLLAAWVGTTSLLLGAQLLLFTHAVEKVLVNAKALHTDAHARSGVGAMMLCVGGLLAITWAVLSLLRLEESS